METAARRDELEDDAPGPVRRIVTLVARVLAAGVGIVASAELLGPHGMSSRTGALAVCAALVGLPALGVFAASQPSRRSRRWRRIDAFVSLAVWIAAGAAILVATSLRPLSHVRGMQTGGLLVVALAMFIVPVLRGGFMPRLNLLTALAGDDEDDWRGGPRARPWS